MMLCKLLSAPELSTFRHCVLSLSDKGILGRKLESLGVGVHVAGFQRRWISPRAIGAFFKLVRHLQPDLVQGWMYHGNLAAVLAAGFAGNEPRVCWNIRHSPYDLKTEKRGTAATIRLGALLSGFPKRIIYNSQASAELHTALGYRNSRQEIIPNGFDLDLFKAEPEQRRRLRRELELEDSALLIGLIARFHPVKAHRLFLHAAGLLCGEFPQLHFLLVGPSGEAAFKTLGEWIQDEGLQGRVHLLGERQDVFSVVAGLDIVTSCSFAEAFPNVIGEAMACEVPCVVTDVGDCAFLVGDTGVVVPPSDPAALAEGWARLIRMGHDGRRQLGKAARNRVASEFSLPAIAGRYHNLYQEILGGNGQNL
jgi:glycosyltransferase involved in cell wall biosynthesis